MLRAIFPLLLSAASSSPLLSFFVAPYGSDSGNSGTSAAAPFRTLLRAQLALRAALSAAPPLTANATVSIAPGVYTEPAALVFTPSDSGSGGFTVRWQCLDASGSPAEGCVLYVGAVIPPSLWAPFQGAIFVANVSALIPPPPPPPPPPSAPGCGLVEPGYSYDGHDIEEVLVPPNNVSACCAACALVPACTAWSLCVNITCGTPARPINCYLKSSAAGRTPFGPLRTSGTLVAPPTPAPPASGAFYALVEGARAATIARVPNRGSGYLAALGVSNSDSSLTWPPNSSSFPAAPFDVSNSFVFCNLGADWFTETRPVTSLDFGARTIHFEGRRNGVAGCNGKAYLQGARELIDEPGEWAHEPATGLLYYWPLDPASLAPGAAAPIVAAPAGAALQFQGSPPGSGGPPVADISLEGLEVRGSGFTPDGAYRVFPPGRPNDFPAPTNTGMVRIEGARNISILRCRLLHAGLSAVWVAGEAQNVTVRGCWIEGAGFCGVTLAGPYPGDGPYASAGAAFVNRGHAVENNLIYNVGTRVGHGAGVWLWQSGENRVAHNYVKEAPRNGVGLYGVRFGAGAGGGQGVLPATAYGVELDFFSALELLTTRDNEVSFNVLENVVRDSCDAGAVESWGVGRGNVLHSNAVSDCDSGGVDGSWMNFLFQDDASHWLNHSSNVVFNVAGKGSEEGGMIKSVFSVCENNVVAYSELGFLFNIQPYIEPAAAMTFARNVFAFLAPAGAPPLGISVNAYTAGTLATSCSIMEDRAQAAVYNFTAASVPSLATPVIAEWDYNLYFNASHGANASAPWDAHAVEADPGFVGAATPPWLRTVADLALAPGSPAFALPGFRRIAVELMGLEADFSFDLGAWARRSAQAEKVQAETCACARPTALHAQAQRHGRAPAHTAATPTRPHATITTTALPPPPPSADDRQVGLWREGSYGISPGAGGWPFAAGAWALYRRVDVAGATRLRVRLQPRAAGLRVALALGAPANVLATFDADAAGAAVGVMAVFEVPLAQPLTVAGGLVFLLPSEGCVIDWFMLP